MHLESMDSGGSLLEVPYVCYHCGGRSDDLSTLEYHIKTEHGKNKLPSKSKKVNRNKEVEEDDDDYDYDDEPLHPMFLEGLVEVEIKEESEFIVPLDLSNQRKECFPEPVWIKQEPLDDPLHIPEVTIPNVPTIPPPCIPIVPKIRVASEAVLKAPVPPPPLLLKVHSLASRAQRPGIPSLVPLDKSAELMSPRFPNAPNSTSYRTIRPLPPLLALPRMPHSPASPKTRMPAHFPQAPYFIEVPYTCYHCGGRSPDLDTLKKHIETMHNPESMLKQRLADQAKRKLLDILEPKNIVRIKIPKPPRIPKSPKAPKEKKIKTKEDGEVKVVPKVIIKVPKPFQIPLQERFYRKKETKKRFSCPFCPFTTDSFRGLILHASVKHEKERALKRQEALESESLASRLASSKSGKNYLYCLFCEYKSLQKPQLKKHMYAIHGKEKHHQCPYCSHRSAYAENMKWHVQKHKFRCPHCSFRAISRTVLLDHENNSCPALFGPVRDPTLMSSEVRGSDPVNAVNNPEMDGNLPNHSETPNNHSPVQNAECVEPDDNRNSVQENGEGSKSNESCTSSEEFSESNVDKSDDRNSNSV